jgi:periplasmic divalent cation tolerance protein
MSKYIVVLVTCPTKEEGERIAESIVLEKLAACVNIVPQVSSIYFWEDKLESSQEALLVIKTKSSLYSDLERRIKEMHSYKVPEIVAIPIQQGYKDYLKWVDESTKQP